MKTYQLKINSKEDYDAAMIKIHALMKVGEHNLTSVQANELRRLALAANAYEKEHTETLNA